MKMAPRHRGLQRAIVWRLDRNRPAGRAADARVATPVAGVEAEHVHPHANRDSCSLPLELWNRSPWRRGLSPPLISPQGHDRIHAHGTPRRHDARDSATRDSTTGTATNVAGSRGCTW